MEPLFDIFSASQACISKNSLVFGLICDISLVGLILLFAVTGSDDCGSHKTSNSTDHMNDASACKVVETPVVRVGPVAEPTAALSPRDHHRIDESGHQNGEEHVGGKLSAFGQRSRHDCSGRGSKRKLESPKDPRVRSVFSVEVSSEEVGSFVADKSALIASLTEGEGKSDCPEGDSTSAAVKQVLYEDVF